MTIRQLSADEAANIVALPPAEALLRSFTMRTGVESCFAVLEAGKAAAHAGALLDAADAAMTVPGRRVYIFGLETVPEYRNMGLASLLLQYIISVYDKCGIHEFSIGVEDGNTAGWRLYERLGFRLLESRDGYSLLLKLTKRRSALSHCP